MTNVQWLTADEKARELSCLVDAIARRAAGERGVGSFDWPMLPWLAALNALPGVCTIQSCCGHRRRTTAFVPHDGHVWLRLSRPVAVAVQKMIGALLDQERIEDVAVRYLRDRERHLPILAVSFQGLDRHDEIRGALQPLLEWLQCTVALVSAVPRPIFSEALVVELPRRLGGHFHIRSGGSRPRRTVAAEMPRVGVVEPTPNSRCHTSPLATLPSRRRNPTPEDQSSNATISSQVQT